MLDTGVLPAANIPDCMNNVDGPGPEVHNRVGSFVLVNAVLQTPCGRLADRLDNVRLLRRRKSGDQRRDVSRFVPPAARCAGRSRGKVMPGKTRQAQKQ